MLKPKNADSFQQQQTTIAALEREIETCKSSLNDCGGYSGAKCTAPGKDAFNNDSKGELDCCDGQIAMWQPCRDRSASCKYCPPSRGPPGPELLCVHEPVDNESWWTHGNNYNSCDGTDGIGTYKNLGFTKCVGDETSISLNMAKLKKEDKDNNCFVHDTKQRMFFKMQDINEISFDAEWDQCDDVWAAPIWLNPSTWKKPQGQSGEIDFVETCRSANYGIKTAIQCGEHWNNPNPTSTCLEPFWGNGRSSYGGKHFIGKIDHNSGDWTMHKCDNLNETNVANCQLISRYPQYLSMTTGTKEQQDFHLVSDVWGHQGKPGDDGKPDGGFASCGNDYKPDTKCSYTVANIKIDYKNK